MARLLALSKEPTYYGITPEFWNSCDAICGEEEWDYMELSTVAKENQVK